jgi:hypothetical protein
MPRKYYLDIDRSGKAPHIIETDRLDLWPEAKRLSASKGKAALVEQSRKWLLEHIKPGDTVHCVLRHVSASGMSRRIDFYVMHDNEPVYITGHAGLLLGYRVPEVSRGMIVGGCGMDMGFSVVYNLSRALFQDNFVCTGERCPSNDHVNGDRNYKPHKHSDGGYALRHKWI